MHTKTRSTGTLIAVTALAFASTVLSGCSMGGSQASGGDSSATSGADFILGTWNCVGYSNGVEDPQHGGVFELTEDKFKITFPDEAGGGWFEAKINRVGDTIYGETVEGPNGYPQAGQKGTLSGIPLDMPTDGEKVTVTFAPDNGARTVLEAYTEKGAIIFQGSTDDGIGAMKCTRK